MAKRIAYSEKLRDPRWQKRRLSILERDGFTCVYCSDTITELHVHHKRYNGEPWEADDDDLETTCKYCHQAITLIGKEFATMAVARITKRKDQFGFQWIFIVFVDTALYISIFKLEDKLLSHQTTIPFDVFKSILDVYQDIFKIQENAETIN